MQLEIALSSSLLLDGSVKPPHSRSARLSTGIDLALWGCCKRATHSVLPRLPKDERIAGPWSRDILSFFALLDVASPALRSTTSSLEALPCRPHLVVADRSTDPQRSAVEHHLGGRTMPREAHISSGERPRPHLIARPPMDR
jgi:hypothetical protein